MSGGGGGGGGMGGWGQAITGIGQGVENMAPALGAREEGHMLRRTETRYQKRMNMALDEFMSVWKGRLPSGMEGFTEQDLMYGGEKTLKLNNILSPKEKKYFAKLGSIDDQNEFLSDILGHDVSLSEKWVRGGKNKYGVKNKLKEIKVNVSALGVEPGTFEAAEKIREMGGAPSMEAQYRPWIKQGEDAYQVMSNAILGGDFTGMMAKDPSGRYFDWVRQEGEKDIKRMEAAGRIPTKSASKELLSLNQNISGGQIQNYLGNLLTMAQFGYSALGDLKSLESHYKGTELSTTSDILANKASMRMREGQLLNQGTTAGVSAIGKGIQSIGGAMGGSGGGGMMGGGGGGSSTGSNNAMGMSSMNWSSSGYSNWKPSGFLQYQ